MEAQLAMNDVPDYKGNVQAFRTDELVDKAAEELFPTWQQNQEEWKKVGSDRPYHYLGSGIWYGRIGKKAGELMVGMMGGAAQAGGDSIFAPRPEPRTFRSADGTKSFEAVFLDFDPGTGLVSVKMKNGRLSKFKIDVLSAEDQEFVRSSKKQ